jgi:hypothetical protein
MTGLGSALSSASKVALTALIVGVYLALCRLWAGHVGTYTAIYECALLWLALSLVVARIWRLGARQTLYLGGGAALCVALWSPLLVDFPNESVERWPLAFRWLLFLGPVFIAFIAGLHSPSKGPLMGALILTLSDLGLLPVRIWNSNAHVAGGWAEYPFPSLPAEIIFLLVSACLGIGFGWVGSRLRLRLTRR